MTLRPLHYHLPLFPGFQLLDVAAPLDILNIRTQYPDTAGITLTVSAATLDPVSVKPVPPPNANWRFDVPAANINTACNQHMVPQCTFADVISALKAGKSFDGSDDIKPVDVLILPGGLGTRLDRIYDENATSGKGRVSNMKEVQDFLVDVAPYVRHSIITICTGSHVLAQTGLLDNRQATTNSARYEDVARPPSAVNWKPNKRWLRDVPPKNAVSGSSLPPAIEIWSSAGITAGIDVMLEFISAHYGGIEIGMQTAKRMEYRWEREREASYFL
jgi:transcriptional regulator GlxA family with amidase domain